MGEEPVGEEAELERRDWALDRHVDDVHDQATTSEPVERRLQRRRPGEVVEREHVLLPSRPGQALGLGERQGRAGRHDQHVVGELRAIGKCDDVSLDVDTVHSALEVVDAPTELSATGSDDVLGVGQPERHEQQAGLIHVITILIHHRDADRRVVCEVLAQPVGGQRAAGASAEYDDVLVHQRPFFLSSTLLSGYPPG